MFPEFVEHHQEDRMQMNEQILYQPKTNSFVEGKEKHQLISPGNILYKNQLLKIRNRVVASRDQVTLRLVQ